MDIFTVPAIMGVVYAVVAAITKATGENEKFKRFIPLTAMGIGCLIGLLAYYFMPNMIVAENAVASMVVGGMSGLAATGGDQIIKQFKKSDSDDEKTDKE